MPACSLLTISAGVVATPPRSRFTIVAACLFRPSLIDCRASVSLRRFFLGRFVAMMGLSFVWFGFSGTHTMWRTAALGAPYDASEIATIVKSSEPSVEEQVDVARHERDRQAFCDRLREELEREDSRLAQLLDLICEEASVVDSMAALRWTVDEILPGTPHHPATWS